MVFLSVLKDKVFQTYKRLIKDSFIINYARERLDSKNYIDSTVEDIPLNELTHGIMVNISEYSKWMAKFAREIPGLERFDVKDFTTIVSNSALLTMALHINEFYINNDYYQIVVGGYQLSRNRMNLLFGTFITSLFYLINSKIRKLNLTECEKALYYPFVLGYSKG